MIKLRKIITSLQENKISLLILENGGDKIVNINNVTKVIGELQKDGTYELLEVFQILLPESIHSSKLNKLSLTTSLGAMTLSRNDYWNTYGRVYDLHTINLSIFLMKSSMDIGLINKNSEKLELIPKMEKGDSFTFFLDPN